VEKMGSALQVTLYKSVVFLLLIVILSEYIKSNELRRSILIEAELFNTRLTQLIQYNKLQNQKINLKQAVLAFGASIAFISEGDSSETSQGGY